MNELESLINLSKYVGERFDLVQAGGGNISVKSEDGIMLIKSSGYSLSDIDKKRGYSKIDNAKIIEILNNSDITRVVDKKIQDELVARQVGEATLDLQYKPSIETLLHSLFYKFTVHTHPIVVNMIVNKTNWQEVLKSIFTENIALVNYKTPGIELALELKLTILEFTKIPQIIFLQNHGLIITAETEEEVKHLQEYVLAKIESYLQVDMSKYKLTNLVSSLINKASGQNIIAFLSNDIDLNLLLAKDEDLFFKMPFCPDSVVYNGIKAVWLKHIEDIATICEYMDAYKMSPKVVIFDDMLFLIAANIRKAREMEDVLRFHVMVLAQNGMNTNFLPQSELDYLLDWEAEKYRQNI